MLSNRFWAAAPAQVGADCACWLCLQAEAEGSVYHSSKVISTGGLDVQTVGKDFVYTARTETRVKVHKRNKTAAGLTMARLTEGNAIPLSVSLSASDMARCTQSVGTASSLNSRPATAALQGGYTQQQHSAIAMLRAWSCWAST